MRLIFTSIAILCSLSVFSQERVDESLPTITKKVSTLKQATGWIKNDIGKWVSAKNGIPNASHDNYYVEEGFIDYTIYRINLDNVEYTMLVKTSDIYFTYWIFDTAQSKLFEDSSYVTNKPAILYGKHYSSGRFTELKLLTEVKSDFKASDNSLDSKRYLKILIKWFPSKKIYRFYFKEDLGYVNDDLEEDNILDKYFETTDSSIEKFIVEL